MSINLFKQNSRRARGELEPLKVEWPLYYLSNDFKIWETKKIIYIYIYIYNYIILYIFYLIKFKLLIHLYKGWKNKYH